MSLQQTLYDIILEGGYTKEIGSVDELGWYGFLDFSEEPLAGYPDLIAVIVEETNLGNKFVYQYDDLDRAKVIWADLEAFYTEFYEDENEN